MAHDDMYAWVAGLAMVSGAITCAGTDPTGPVTTIASAPPLDGHFIVLSPNSS